MLASSVSGGQSILLVIAISVLVLFALLWYGIQTRVGADRYSSVVARTTVPIPTRVLVTGMRHDDGEIVAAELYAVAEACGQTSEQVRSCLRRLVKEGLYLQHGKGRSARYEATEAGIAHLETGWARTRTAYQQDAAGRGWDRMWHLVAFAVPEDRRAARDQLRDRLVALGGAALQGGVYVSPHPWDDAVRHEAKRLDLADHLSLATTDDLEIGGVRDPRQLALTLVADRRRRARVRDVHRAVPPGSRSARGHATAQGAVQ